jgi:hypothetical protein
MFHGGRAFYLRGRGTALCEVERKARRILPLPKLLFSSGHKKCGAFRMKAPHAEVFFGTV